MRTTTYQKSVKTSTKRPQGWPAPTHLRSWSESEAQEAVHIFARSEEDRFWDNLAEQAERQARLDQGLCL